VGGGGGLGWFGGLSACALETKDLAPRCTPGFKSLGPSADTRYMDRDVAPATLFACILGAGA
jgi:hypothetical protein